MSMKKSWIENANGFGLNHLPYGAFRANGSTRLCVRIGDFVLDLAACAAGGLCDSLPAEVRASQTFRRAFLVASAAWLVGHSVRAVVRLWLLNLGLPLSVYLVLDTVAGWPINVSLVAFTTWYPLRELHRAGFMTPAATPLTTLDAVELAVEESAPTTV